jgi:hypothetical protein
MLRGMHKSPVHIPHPGASFSQSFAIADTFAGPSPLAISRVRMFNDDIEYTSSCMC